MLFWIGSKLSKIKHMNKTQIKPGPKPFYSLTTEVEFTLDPVKVSSFKSMVSKLNKGKLPEEKLRFDYAMKGRKMIATRLPAPEVKSA